MTSTTAPAGGAHGRATTRLLEAVGPPGVAVCPPASEWAAVGLPGGGGGSDHQPLRQICGPWLPWHTEVYTGLSIYYCESFIFLDH
jgi:hypothetical protein